MQLIRPTIKIALVGPGGVGKSTIAKRLVSGNYLPTEMTVGLNIESWSFMDSTNECVVKATLFDLGGQPQFRFFQESLIKGADFVLIVVDLSDFDTFRILDEWISLISFIPRDRWLLIGNKIDKVDDSVSEDIVELATSLGVRYVLVSAMTGYNFDKLKHELTQLVLHNM